MQKRREFDYIIVGQGLAGSALSYQLMKAGRKVLVFDSDRPTASSRVAAGLYNPVTGRKMVKTWAADVLFPYLITFYKELEQVCSDKFLIEIPIYRPFLSLEEQNEWMGKSASQDFSPFIKKIHREPVYSFSNDEYGGVELASSGYLNVPAFLKAYRGYLESRSALETLNFDLRYLSVGQDRVAYKNFLAKRLIFCDGIGALHNSFFNWLPFRPVKGEILQIKAKVTLKSILNRGVFVIPLGNGCFKVGSNYDNSDMTTETTGKAREEIVNRLKMLMNINFRIIGQEAGIRPATKDRRPFIGLHPEYKTIGILNGLGTKGVSLAPYFSGELVQFLERGKELHPEVNVSRFFSLYYNSLKPE